MYWYLFHLLFFIGWGELDDSVYNICAIIRLSRVPARTFSEWEQKLSHTSFHLYWTHSIVKWNHVATTYSLSIRRWGIRRVSISEVWTHFKIFVSLSCRWSLYHTVYMCGKTVRCDTARYYIDIDVYASKIVSPHLARHIIWKTVKVRQYAWLRKCLWHDSDTKEENKWVYAPAPLTDVSDSPNSLMLHHILSGWVEVSILVSVVGLNFVQAWSIASILWASLLLLYLRDHLKKLSYITMTCDDRGFCL